MAVQTSRAEAFESLRIATARRPWDAADALAASAAAAVTPAFAPAVARRRRAADRAPVSRAGELLPAVVAVDLLAVGLLLRILFATGPSELLALSGGCFVAAVAMDLYARVAGAWAAWPDRGAATACALLGTPAVIWHALARRSGEARIESGTLGAIGVIVAVVLTLYSGAAY